MLSLHLVFVRQQAEDYQPSPYPLLFRSLFEALGLLFPIFCATISARLGTVNKLGDVLSPQLLQGLS